MADNNGKELCARAERLFAGRVTWWGLAEELAGKFAPDLGYFFVEPQPGDDYAAHNLDASSMNAFEDFARAKQMMLRPPDRQWMNEVLPEGMEGVSLDAQDWMKRRTRVAWKLLHMRSAKARDALRTTDRLNAAFGEFCLGIERLIGRDGRPVSSLLFTAFHPRDYVFALDRQRELLELHRKAPMRAGDAHKLFRGQGLHANIVRRATENAARQRDTVCQIRHCLMASDEYEYVTREKPAIAQPWVSVWYDAEHEQVIKEQPQAWPMYVVGRWQTLPGIPWGYSPMAMIALATARRNDELMLALLEHTQKSADPPVVATSDVVDGEMDLGASGVTWIDRDYDERSGEAVRTLRLEGNISSGLELLRDGRALLDQAWNRNKLVLPSRAKTAYETQQLIEEYIQANLPIFSPLEENYTAPILEAVAAAGEAMGAYGSPQFQAEFMPAELRGRDTEFAFDTPLKSARDRQKLLSFEQSLQLTAGVRELEPEAAFAFNTRLAFAQTLGVLGEPEWVLGEDEMESRVAQFREQQAQQQQMMMAQQGAEVAERMGRGVQALGGAGALGAGVEAVA